MINYIKFMAILSLALLGGLPTHAQELVAPAEIAESRETREVPAFEGISANARAPISISVGQPQSITLMGAKEDLERISLEVEDGILMIRQEADNVMGIGEGFQAIYSSGRSMVCNMDKGTFVCTCDGKECDLGQRKIQGPVEIFITVPDLKSITLAGVSTATIDKVNRNDFVVKLSGSSYLTLPDVRLRDLEVRLSGNGRLQARGLVVNMGLQLSGSSSIDASDLVAQDADVEVSGSAHAEVNVLKKLDARASGVGSILYHAVGRLVVSERRSGMGSIQKIK